MEYKFHIGSKSLGDRTVGKLTVYFPGSVDKRFHSPDLVNLKIVEQDGDYFILLIFISLNVRNATTLEFAIGNNQDLIKVVKKFIVNLNNNNNRYILSLESAEDLTGYSFVVDANSSSLLEIENLSEKNP